MPFDELKVQVPEAKLADYEIAVQCFLALSPKDKVTLRQIFVLGPRTLDMDYYKRLVDSGLICGVATSAQFLMACTFMGGLICKAYQDHFEGGSLCN